MGRLGDSWELMMVSLRLVKNDKTILLYPFLSGLISIIIVITFIGGIFFAGFLGFLLTPFAIILFFLLYFILFFIGIYFNTAIIAFAKIKLDGGKPTLGDGLKVANENLGAIIMWALVAGTVGIILRMIEEKVGVLGKIVISIIGFAWSMATFFIIPVLIYEKTPIMKSIKRSAHIFKDTWGETLIGHFAFGIFFFLLGILGIFFIILGVLLGGIIGLLIGLVLAIVYWIFIGCLAIATQGVLVTVLYQFATTRKIHPDFPAHLIDPGATGMRPGDAYAPSTVATSGIDRDVEMMRNTPPPPPPGQDVKEPEAGGVSVTSVIEDQGPETGLSESDMVTVKRYMEFFDISEVRAVNLYLAGYKKLDDFKDAIADDLAIIDKINPTVARRIIDKMESE